MTINDIMAFHFSMQGYGPSDFKTNTSDSNIYYNGFVDIEGKWKIIETNRTNGTYRYVRGDSGYEAAFASRESLTYDYFDEIFK